MGQNVLDPEANDSDMCVERLENVGHSVPAELREECEDVTKGSDEGLQQFQSLSIGAKRDGTSTAMNSQMQSATEPKLHKLLSQFLKVQEDRAGLYSVLQSGFTEYLKTGSELSFQQLCRRVTTAFNDCSRQVLDIQAALRDREIGREDLADILQEVQAQEKQNLRMTATLQVLRKAGRPSERPHVHADKKDQQQCSHSHDEESSALELAELEAEYDAAYKEATRALQEARTAIHEFMEEVRYEMASGGTV